MINRGSAVWSNKVYVILVIDDVYILCGLIDLIE